jgi:hypothetical protein
MKKCEGTNGAANDPIARSPGLLLRKPTICIVQLALSEEQYYYYYSKNATTNNEETRRNKWQSK